ncbi:hypothetical protein BKA62DRAFT_716246 [Auriculariales sp. MPI-PUGE-AT-0066]|nr:hypothetical protein BKA62DRAFT_716246 [Auriculariales sp. MPI-PUGE-AT-0066]
MSFIDRQHDIHFPEPRRGFDPARDASYQALPNFPRPQESRSPSPPALLSRNSSTRGVFADNERGPSIRLTRQSAGSGRFSLRQTQNQRYPIKDAKDYDEFEKRYPPDRYGDEANDNARVWKIYRDRASDSDQDLIDGWNKTLDILLIFAGLFSAVTTTFVLESYKLLQPDYTEVLARAFLSTQLGGSNSSNPVDVEDPDDFTAPTPARLVNALWFISLALALFVSLLAILAKQWLGEYDSRMRAPVASSRRWVSRHIVFSRGLARWKLDAFISALPMALHISLFLFFIGLIVFLWDIDRVIAGVLLVSSVLLLLFYVGAAIAPLFSGDCPTATPALRQIYSAYQMAKETWYHLRYGREDVQVGPFVRPEAAFNENKLVSRHEPFCESEALRWMITSLPVTNEINVALDAVGALPVMKRSHYFREYPKLDDPLISQDIYSALGERLVNLGSSPSAHDMGCILRSLIQIGGSFSTMESYKYQLEPMLKFCLEHDFGTFDVLALANRILLAGHDIDSYADVIAFFTAHAGPDSAAPILPSTMSLLLRDFRGWQYGDLAKLYNSGLKLEEDARTLLIERVEDSLKFDVKLFQDGYMALDPAVTNEFSDILYRTSRTWAVVLQHAQFALSNKDTATVLCAYFDSLAAIPSQKVVEDPLGLIPEFSATIIGQLYETIDSEYFPPETRWSESTLHGATNFLASSIRRDWRRYIEVPVKGRRIDVFPWSAQLGCIVSTILAQCATPTPAGTQPIQDVDTIVTSIMHAVCSRGLTPSCADTAHDIGRYSSLERALAESRINLLVPNRYANGRSVWAIGFELSAHNRLALAPLARELSILVCLVHRALADSEDGRAIAQRLAHELVDEDRGFDIILKNMAANDYGYDFARHMREVLPEWWSDAANRMREMDAQGMWQVPERRFPTAESWIAAVEAEGICSSCPARLEFDRTGETEHSTGSERPTIRDASNTSLNARTQPEIMLFSYPTPPPWYQRIFHSGRRPATRASSSSKGIRMTSIGEHRV